MMYNIRRRRCLGIAIERKEFDRMQPLRADVHITECENVALGRTTISAWIFTSAPNSPEPLPHLLDVKIVGMASNGLVLSGVEQIGNAFYAQSWLCQIV